MAPRDDAAPVDVTFEMHTTRKAFREQPADRRLSRGGRTRDEEDSLQVARRRVGQDSTT
jgi:hypothetical protein